MRILNQYIGMAVVGGTLLVLFVLLALFSFVGFVAELEEVGTGNYELIQAGEFVLLSLPRLAYQLFPVAALLGSMIGLGVMASNNELLVMRAAGVSLMQVVASVMKAGLVLMVAAAVLGEVIATKAEQYAQDLRTRSLEKHLAFK
ncbi:MAG TPA: LptF/LptG family permease, partial [Gammaproteobacteria bacterium]